jgi:hypothetical protein
MSNELHKASNEQQLIIDNVKKGDNVISLSVPGSGKSYSITLLAQALKGKKFLQITYNAMLRKEFKEKLLSLDINNVNSHTYHSFAVKHFNLNAYTDNGIRKILSEEMKEIVPIPYFDIIILDEVQDMSHLYYQFIIYFLKKLISKVQIVFLGDDKQGIYNFLGSDIRFLTMAEKLWKNQPFLNSQIFHNCTLRMSYRITNQMAAFINTSMIGKPLLLSCRDGIPVQYIRNTTYNTEIIVLNIIKRIIDEGDLPNDIFILASSIKGVTSSIKKIENALSQIGIPCFIPNIDTEKVDERVIDNKIVFSTFHSAKGRQRKYVFVVGFDDSYMDYAGRDLPKNICPNTLFVASTRATHGLYLLEGNNNSFDKPLEFLHMNHHDMKRSEFVNFKGNAQSIFYEKPKFNKDIKKIIIYKTNATEMIKFISEDTMDIILPIIDKIFQRSNCILFSDEENIPSIIKLKNGMYEEVSDLNGIAIPCIFYDHMVINDRLIQENTLYQLIQENIQDMKPNDYTFLKEIFNELDPVCKTISDYLYMSNVYMAIKEKLYFKLKQIQKTEYNWLSNETIEKCKNNLKYHILKPNTNKSLILHEETILKYDMEDEHKNIDLILEKNDFLSSAKYRFTARIDLITEEDIFEIKCTSQITTEHLLQLSIYAFLWKAIHPESEKKFKILNITTNELMIMNATMNELIEIVVALLKGKYGKQKILSDEEFLEKYACPLL